MGTADDEGAALWPDRYLTEGRLVVVRSPRRERTSRWARLRTAAVRLDRAARARLGRPSPPPEPPSPAPEAAFAAWDTTEARVAAAAGRAWAETVREPSWSSPLLAASRFDGQAEVDRIVDLALRIRSARVSLGVRPPGTAAEYWDRQSAALEAAALRLGHRADALIRYRDQAALLSAELRQLADLERLERSAAEVDGITAATSALPGRGDGDLRAVADEIGAVRSAVGELVELMTRTRAPLVEPPG
jgi:HAMP domain-containing protein